MQVRYERIDKFRIRLPKTGCMRTDGLVYLNDKLLSTADQGLVQVCNVACLPGIVGRALAMPDIHWGYGFPIGGVAAFDPDEGGIVSPGGVGYDINCGVRLYATDLPVEDLRPRIDRVLEAVYRAIPAGVGSERRDFRQTDRQLRQVMELGAEWAVKHGFGSHEDLEHIEDRGCLPADPEAVSKKALDRGRGQLGTLGSGNHFLEIGYVETVFEPSTASVFGLEPGTVTVLLHSGSRGLGYQVCEDWVRIMVKASPRYGIQVPDKQLSSVPIHSREGEQYLGAMGAAANFAFANRQIMGSDVQKAMLRALGMGPADLGMRLVYDVCHNIAKLEEHDTPRGRRTLCVHRKGATRSLGPGHPKLPESYRDVGQPVLVPGDMGTESYVLAGTTDAERESFSSCCHGAGRVMSRKQALKSARGRSVFEELERRGVAVRAASKRTVAEEMPDVYKDVSDVVRVATGAKLARLVARLKPLAVVKG